MRISTPMDSKPILIPLLISIGGVLTPVMAQNAEPLTNQGYRVVERKQRESTFGLADPSGKEILPPKYEAIDLGAVPGYVVAGNYKPDLASVLGSVSQNLSYYTGGTPGTQIGNVTYMTTTYRYNLRYGLFDRTGKKILDIAFDEIEALGPHIKVWDKSGSCGLYDTKGNQLIATKYKAIYQQQRYIVAMDRSGGKYHYRIYNWDGSPFLTDDFEYLLVPTPKLLIKKKDGVMSLSRIGGQDILKGEYDEISYLDSGYLAVKKSGRWGIMDTMLTQHAPFKFDDVLVRPGKRWFANLDGKWGQINSAGEFISSTHFCRCYESPARIIPFYYKGKRGYIDEHDQWAIQGDFDFTNLFIDGLASVSVKGKYGVINEKGDWIVPPKNYSHGSISEGIISIQPSYFPLTKVLYDYKGNQIAKVPFAYNLTEYTNGLAAYSDKTAKWGYVDKAGVIKIKSKFGRYSPFDANGLAIVSENSLQELQAVYGIINTRGEYVSDNMTNIFPFHSNYLVKGVNGKYQLLGSDGKLKQNLPYDSASILGKHILVRSSGKYGLVSISGETLMEVVYEDIKLADEAKGWVWFKRGLYGIYDIKSKKELSPPAFEDVSLFDDGIAFARSGKWGAINADLKQVIAFKYENFLDQPWLFGTKAVSTNGFWGLIDKHDKIVLPFNYDEITRNATNPKYYNVTAFGITSCLDSNLLESVTVY